MNGRLLVFNCHEPWVYQLHALHQPLDIITDLPGRHMRGWDTAVRPVPANARLISLPVAQQFVQQGSLPYDCIIAHNITDLLDAKMLAGPRLLVLHLTLDGMLLEQRARTSADELRAAAGEYLRRTSTHVVPVSLLKGRSWGITGDVVKLSADPDDYLPWQGDLACGLRVSSFITRRARTLLWGFHQMAFVGVPVTLVGHNPELPDVHASRNWGHLKTFFQRHRFYIHTAHPDLEDGYNMATLEAMAAGMPVIGNLHPTSPIEHGVSGFLSDDPLVLRSHANLLLADRELARTMGQAGQHVAAEHFSAQAFAAGMRQAISKAQEMWACSRVVSVA